MKLQLARDIIECLPTGHTPFLYSRDDYAFHLLIRALDNHTQSVHQIKKSTHASLLHKSKVKKFLAQLGNQTLNSDILKYGLGGPDATKFNLSLSTWGGDKHDSPMYTQNTRGKTSLVLQLNWDLQKVKMLETSCSSYVGNVHYGGYYHPISKNHNTLAWARIDCDLDTGEALIEEVQSDWIRGYINTESQLFDKIKYSEEQEVKQSIQKLLLKESYTFEKIKHHKKIWAETTLLAALSFIRKDLGIEKIYYHSFESGCALKRIEGSKPPRSLYTELPKKFCMQRSSEIPSFLEKDRYFNRQRKKLRIPVEFFQLPPLPTSSSSPVVAGLRLCLNRNKGLSLPLCRIINMIEKTIASLTERTISLVHLHIANTQKNK